VNVDRKVRRFSRKDYTSKVSFPVEIVGRDNRVRRYAYRDALRLYERRLQAAPVRFRDAEAREAEQQHCVQRVAQLRESYFCLQEGEGRELWPSLRRRHPAWAGEVAAWLNELLGLPADAYVVGSVGQLSTGGEVWELQSSRHPSLLLYLFPFGERGNAPSAVLSRRALRRLCRQLDRVGAYGGNVERKVAVHMCLDVGMVLTGRSDDVADLASRTRATLPENKPGDSDPWEQILGLVRQGDYPTALLRSRWLLDGQPYHREAYRLASVLSLEMHRPMDAEEIAYVGSRYFPHDALLSYLLGQARAHQGRREAARHALSEALQKDEKLVVARSLHTVLSLELGRFAEAFRVGRGLHEVDGSVDARRHRELMALLGRLTSFTMVAVVTLGIALGSVGVLGEVALLPLAMMLVLSLTTLGAVVLLLPHVEGAALSLWPPLPTLDPANIAFLVAFVGWMPAPFDTSVWHSQWSVEKAHTEGKVPFKEARFDFHVGYAGTAVLALCFLFLGAGVLHGTGQEVPVAAPAFAAMLVDVYASILGPAARPVILLAAFTTMLSTTLAVTDGYPRAMAGALAAWRGEDAPERPAERRGTLLLLLALAMGVIVWFAANLKGLVDFATTVSFVFTPLLAVFNYRSLRLPGVPEGFRLSVAGIWAHRLAIGAMSLGSLAYLGWRFL